MEVCDSESDFFARDERKFPNRRLIAAIEFNRSCANAAFRFRWSRLYQRRERLEQRIHLGGSSNRDSERILKQRRCEMPDQDSSAAQPAGDGRHVAARHPRKHEIRLRRRDFEAELAQTSLGKSASSY